MYLDFFGLREQPFGVTPDPAFLYLSPTHREALESLRSDLENDRGFMILIGEPGLGKTTLLYKLLEEWNPTTRVVFLFQTQCDSREFFRYLLAELGIDAESMGLVGMHQALNQMLFHEMLAGKRFVLIVDEAQNLDNSVLETVRGLSNFETDHSKLLNIVLAGQSQLADKLGAPELRQLRQRIGILNRLRPLSATETAEYIQHRLGQAGYHGDPIFTSDALLAIAQSSQGAPRIINQICHHALMAAEAKGDRTINLGMAQSVITKLEGRNIEPAPPTSATPVKPVAPSPVPVSAPVAKPLPPAAPSVRPDPPPAAVLSYGWSREPKTKVRNSATIASCVLLLVGTAYAVPSARRFVVQEYRNLSSSVLGSTADAVAVSSPEFSSMPDATAAAYDPETQDSQTAQVITVASKPGQTIEELSRLYAGHFDQQIYQQIRSLNPDLKDPDHLDAGQLIRLPLPPGKLKKVVDTADGPTRSESGPLQMALAKIKGLFATAKH